MQFVFHPNSTDYFPIYISIYLTVIQWPYLAHLSSIHRNCRAPSICLSFGDTSRLIFISSIDISSSIRPHPPLRGTLFLHPYKSQTASCASIFWLHLSSFLEYFQLHLSFFLEIISIAYAEYTLKNLFLHSVCWANAYNFLSYAKLTQPIS